VKIIGAGLGRTGTHSLKIALEFLFQGACYHMMELFQRPDDIQYWQSAADGKKIDWQEFMSPWVATVDWPGAPLFDQMAAAFPDALVLLSTRDSETWFKSCNDTIFQLLKAGQSKGRTEPLTKLMATELKQWLTTDLSDKNKVISAYEIHNQRVRESVEPGRLIEWSPEDGWLPICSKLNLTVPEIDFPHLNATQDFQATMSAAMEGRVQRGF